jgi:hypothetical protein
MKFEDRMNRYVKKEEYARKSFEDIAHTLQQLNEYNTQLVAENECLKREGGNRMAAALGI